MTKGLLYYNSGTKCLARLAVSLYTLRKVYDGPVILLADGKGQDICRLLAKEYDLILKENNYEYQYKHSIFLNATLSHKNSPFDLTCWVDADTVILKRFDEMWDYAEQNEFAIAKFAHWVSTGKFVSSRITSWQYIYPELIESALNFGPAINCGIFSFRKDSKFMNDWYNLAKKGDELFIPDETCCQVVLHKYPHIIVDPKFNTSCRYGIINDDTRIIHFHGAHHVALKGKEHIYNSNIWWKYYKEIENKEYVQKSIKYDKYLVEALERLN